MMSSWIDLSTVGNHLRFCSVLVNHLNTSRPYKLYLKTFLKSLLCVYLDLVLTLPNFLTCDK